jgi:hypothetical protein
MSDDAVADQIFAIGSEIRYVASARARMLSFANGLGS